MYFGYKVQMDVTIRRGSKNSLYSDKLMKKYPCFVNINGHHNHSLEAAEALKQLHVAPTIRMMFEKYFEQGMDYIASYNLNVYLYYRINLACMGGL